MTNILPEYASAIEKKSAVKAYGVSQQPSAVDSLARHVEEISNLGFTIIKDVLDNKEVAILRDKLFSVYARQVAEVGHEILEKTAETNQVRCPLAYDDYFVTVAMNKNILDIVKEIIGNFVILHLQNGVIVLPKVEHHQTSWHRDLPYQEFVISKPLALSAMFCLDSFEPKNGGTCLLPFSHKITTLPSSEYIKKWQMDIVASAGSVILFDSMLFHRAGSNRSDNSRLGINHVYTVPMIKQQINLPIAMGSADTRDAETAQFLGYSTMSSDSVSEFRARRYERIQGNLSK